VTTSGQNTNPGTLTYTVFLDPGTNYTAASGTSPKTVTVTVN